MSEPTDQGQGNAPRPGDSSRPSDSRAMHAPPPPPPGYYPNYPPPPKRGGVLSRIVGGFITSVLVLSLLANFYLGAIVAASARGPNESVYTRGDDVEERIVILPVRGMIDDSTAGFVFEALRVLAEDAPKAIILRVDSGGGGVAASDRIWHMLKQFKAKHNVPVIASFGSVAASGGYYISAPADFIIAEPTCITGSIGVIAQAFTVQELLDKIGVTPEIIAATEATSKDVLNPFRAWTDRDRTELQQILDEAHERFVMVVHEGRSEHITLERTRELANGSPMTTPQAVASQLIDGEGYLDDAIVKAMELAGISAEVKPHVTVINPTRSFGVMSMLGSQSSAPQVDAQQIRKLLTEMTTPRMEYQLTY